MTDTNPRPGDPSRRTVLKRTAAIAAMAGLGSATFSGIARAHGCPRAPEYWARNDWPDPVSDPFELAGVSRSQAEWQRFLAAPASDKADRLAKQVIAAHANWYIRPSDDPGCVDASIGDEAARLETQAIAVHARADHRPGDESGCVDAPEGADLLEERVIAARANWYYRFGDELGCVDAPAFDLAGDVDLETMRDVLTLSKRWLVASDFGDGRQESWLVPSARYPYGEVLASLLAGFNDDRLGLDCDCDGG